MRAFSSIALSLALMVLATATSAGATGQQTLQRVKDLYSQAAYEDALGVLSGLASEEPVTEVARYRVACLLALGRADDARKAVDDIVEKHPEYLPEISETSPRVMELFHTARLTILPAVARTTYNEARAAMDRQELPRAIDGFTRLIRLIDDPDVAGDSALSDLRVLSEGFLDLARVRADAAKPKPEVPAATPAATVPGTPPVVTPALPISQQLPPWTPLNTGRWEFAGAVRVRIGEDGKVIAATIEKPVHPLYDGLLLTAARQWTYQPARQNGVPVPSERTVQVILKPR
jgi:hypothetical protein